MILLTEICIAQGSTFGYTEQPDESHVSGFYKTVEIFRQGVVEILAFSHTPEGPTLQPEASLSHPLGKDGAGAGMTKGSPQTPRLLPFWFASPPGSPGVLQA